MADPTTEREPSRSWQRPCSPPWHWRQSPDVPKTNEQTPTPSADRTGRTFPKAGTDRRGTGPDPGRHGKGEPTPHPCFTGVDPTGAFQDSGTFPERACVSDNTRTDGDGRSRLRPSRSRVPESAGEVPRCSTPSWKGWEPPCAKPRPYQNSSGLPANSGWKWTP